MMPQPVNIDRAFARLEEIDRQARAEGPEWPGLRTGTQYVAAFGRTVFLDEARLRWDQVPEARMLRDQILEAARELGEPIPPRPVPPPLREERDTPSSSIVLIAILISVLALVVLADSMGLL